MIRIENLTKSFDTRAGRHFLFKSVNLEIPAGHNVGILGPNGAGKSTFLRILGGIDFPDEGKIHCPYSLSWPLGIAGGFIGHLTGRENCTLVCRSYGLQGKAMQERLEFIKDLSGIGKYFEEPIRYYSTGMNGRLNFALSMAFDFDYFLIDEVTAAGDIHFREQAKAALDEKRAQSNVIMVSHSMGSLRDFCDVGIVLRDGEMRYFEDLDEAIKAYFPAIEKKKKGTLTPFQGDLDKFLDEAFADIDASKKKLATDLQNALYDLESSLETAVNIEDEALVYHQVGVLYFQLGSWHKALEYHRKAIYLEEQKLQFYPAFVTCLIQCGLKEEAGAVIDRVLSWVPDQNAMLSQKAMLCLQLGRLDEARDYALEVVKLESENGARWHQLANIYLVRGEYDKALETQMKTLEYDAKTPGHWELLSRILAGLGQWERSVLARMRIQKLVREKDLNKDETKEQRGLLSRVDKLFAKL